MTTETLSRANTYPATCIRCRGRVAAGQGYLARENGRWAADHKGDCPEKPMAIAAPAVRALADTDGIYRHPDDGTIWKVQIAKQGSGNLYAKRLVLSVCDDGAACGHPTTIGDDGEHRHGHFTYAAGAIHTILSDWKLDREEAVAFGRLYGVCVRCGADLTDENSIKRGMGPWCAGKFE